MSHTPQRDQQHLSTSAEALAVAARRRAILQGLGKGGVALAALSPLASQASRSHKLPNGALPGGFGYCTVSGFQSAAISGSPAPVLCGAYTPGHFVAEQTLTYENGNLGINGSVNGNKLRDALNAKYLVTVFNNMNVLPLLSATPGTIAVAGSNVVLQGLTSNTCRALTRENWPSATLDPLATFQSLFPNSSDTRPLLAVLDDGVVNSMPASANCYFLAAYLSIGQSGVTLPVGFDRTYVVSQYQATGYNSATTQYKFFQTLCVTP